MAPDEPEQSGCAVPPSLDEVLAEVDPFLQAIGAREWRDCVRHLALTNIGRIAQECIRVDALFKPGLIMISTNGAPPPGCWWGSDKRLFSPGVPFDVFKDRSVPALVMLVDLLLSAGMSIEGDVRGVVIDNELFEISSLGNHSYNCSGSPLNAVINGICGVERIIYNPDPGELYNRSSLAILLDYMFRVFEVLMDAGASCSPCDCEYNGCSRGSLEQACMSPWQCGPSSHSGRIFTSLLSAGIRLCTGSCGLKAAAQAHSAWKVKLLLQLTAGNMEKDSGDVLFRAVEDCAESVEEEEMQIEVIQQLVQAGARQERDITHGPRDVLSAAIEAGCGLKVVECLVGLGARISLPSLGAWVKMQRCSVELVEYLVRNATTVNFRVRDIGILGLLHSLFSEYQDDAVHLDCVAKLRCLIDAGADVNAMDMGETPLAAYMWRAAVPDALVVQVLLDAGANPNYHRDLLRQSFIWGCPSPEVTRLLIHYGVDVNQADSYTGQTLLHDLCRWGVVTDSHAFSQALGILLDSGVDVNAKDSKNGNTPLHVACGRDRPCLPMVTALLVAVGADANATNNKGFTPLHCVVSHRHDPEIAANIIDALVTAGAHVNATNSSGCAPLHLAALHGNMPAIARLLFVGADVKLLDLRDGGLLHYAACSPYPFLSSSPSAHALLMDLGVNARDHIGLSPLHWAARGSHNQTNLKVMLAAGADVNARDHQGRTPLHHAARLGIPRIAKYLVSAGTDANALDCHSNTALTLAAQAGSYEGVIELLKAGISAPENVATELGEPLAINGTEFGPSNILRKLLQMVQFLEKEPNTPSHTRRQLQITLLCNLHDTYKNYPLHVLREWICGHDRMLRILVDYPPVYNMQARMLGQGGFGDCYVGTFFGRSVVSKQLRFHYEREKYMKHLLHEASIWRRLHHPNITPFLGLAPIDGLPHLMSPLMQNGAADDFVRKNPNVDRVRLLVQIAQGLEYMHTQNPPIIHGDLKANNILVSEDGSACISDFGLSRVFEGTGSAVTLAASSSSAPAPITMAYHANFRWGAPEVLLLGMPRTPASDIFSLGRLMVELLTGEIPFPGLADQAIILHLDTGRYERPANSDAMACGLDDEMWALILKCWNRDPPKRPTAAQVVERLLRMPEPASVHPSWEATVGGDESSGSRTLISSEAMDSTADLLNVIMGY